MEWLNYHHLLYFWVVAKEGSIVRASEELHLAHPTISGQIHRLEEVLGEKLLTRRGRNLVLTESGRVAFRYADEIFSLGREFVDTLKGRASGKPLRLVVGVADVLPPSLVRRFLEPAFRLWAQIVSRPSPEQAFANAGKRDAAYDLDLPFAQVVRRDGTERPATGISVTGLSDQHAWLRTTPEADLEVGDWLGLGLSHPCTSFDKWQLIPLVEADGTVVDYIRTFF